MTHLTLAAVMAPRRGEDRNFAWVCCVQAAHTTLWKASLIKCPCTPSRGLFSAVSVDSVEWAAVALEQWQQATVIEFVTPLMVVMWVCACVHVCARLCVYEELKDVVNLIFRCKVLRAS